jgi:hypothetical protein
MPRTSGNRLSHRNPPDLPDRVSTFGRVFRARPSGCRRRWTFLTATFRITRLRPTMKTRFNPFENRHFQRMISSQAVVPKRGGLPNFGADKPTGRSGVRSARLSTGRLRWRGPGSGKLRESATRSTARRGVGAVWKRPGLRSLAEAGFGPVRDSSRPNSAFNRNPPPGSTVSAARCGGSG